MLGGSRKRQVCFSRSFRRGRANTLRRQVESSRDFLFTSMGGRSSLWEAEGKSLRGPAGSQSSILVVGVGIPWHLPPLASASDAAGLTEAVHTSASLVPLLVL